MIETTGPLDYRDFTGRDNWLERYCRVACTNGFPTSWQLLCGIFALTTFVGRRAKMVLPEVTLYPPVSIMILGLSGVGKSCSLRVARNVLKIACSGLDSPFILDHSMDWTPSGLLEVWRKFQKPDGIGHGYPLEGAYTVDEFGAILQKSTGKENAPRFLINCLEHGNLRHSTVSRGQFDVKNVTIAFGMPSTLTDIRSTITAEQFASGLMHRFLIAHETTLDPDASADHIDMEQLYDLSMELQGIRKDAPEELRLSPTAMKVYLALRKQCREMHFSTSCLSGYWNRFPGMAVKLAAARTLARHEDEIQPEDIERAVWFNQEKVYPPLLALVRELEAGPKIARLYQIADDAFKAGPIGISDEEMNTKVPGSSTKQQADAIAYLTSIGQLFRSGDRYFRLKEWSDAFELHGPPIANVVDISKWRSVAEEASNADGAET